MSTVTAHVLRAFVSQQGGGNLAGVVSVGSDLTEEVMQKVALKLGYSETAFVQRLDDERFRLRFFTPEQEVDLCGHATIAAFASLFRQGEISEGVYTQETLAGSLHVTLGSAGDVWMEQTLPEYHEEIPIDIIFESLRIQQSDILKTLPIQAVSTGLKDILVPVASLATLLDIKPNFGKIAEVSKVYDAIGYHVFSLETKRKMSQAHCRNFAPLVGIDEEPATGTSNGALCCYLFDNSVIDGHGSYVFEQGYSMNKPSEILAKLDVNTSEIRNVVVGGRAVFDESVSVEI